MIRQILCEKCGALVPMHPEDVMAGWKRRRTMLNARKPDEHHITINGVRQPELPSLLCDLCGVGINDGKKAIAVTMWRESSEPPMWEKDYQIK